jgi:hypothetical protein
MAPPDRTVGSPFLDRARSASWSQGAIGLLLTPSVAAIAALVLPHFPLGERGANLVVFGGAASTTLAALGIAAAFCPRWSSRLAVALVAMALLAGFAALGVASSGAAVAVDAALVAAAWAIGTSIGRRIEHPGHLLPACVVVACADAASMVSRFGPTHAMAESERALSVVAVAFPVPGTSSFAPVLGIGDLIFVAIVLGAAAAHGLSMGRVAAYAWIGALAAGAVSAVLETAVPALVTIGAAVALGIPEVRRIRPQERRIATMAMAIAVSLAAAVIVAQIVHPAAEVSAP